MPAGLGAVVFAGLGAASASAISQDALAPLVMVVLIGVALFVTLRPAFGTHLRLHLRTPARALSVIAVTGVGIAFYDGILGPGTGTFLIIAFTTILGMDFVSGRPTPRSSTRARTWAPCWSSPTRGTCCGYSD